MARGSVQQNVWICLGFWSRRSDLNRGPADYESAALPTELRRQWRVETLDSTTDSAAAEIPSPEPRSTNYGLRTTDYGLRHHPYFEHPAVISEPFVAVIDPQEHPPRFRRRNARAIADDEDAALDAGDER